MVSRRRVPRSDSIVADGVGDHCVWGGSFNIVLSPIPGMEISSKRIQVNQLNDVDEYISLTRRLNWV